MNLLLIGKGRDPVPLPGAAASEIGVAANVQNNLLASHRGGWNGTFHRNPG